MTKPPSISLDLELNPQSELTIDHSQKKKIAIMGCESTGKTTLCRGLAQRFSSYWTPEYFRFYWQGKHLANDKPVWTSTEFVHQSIIQVQLEEFYISRTSRYLFCDSTPLQTSVWHRRYLGYFSEEIENMLPKYDLIILCSIDTPFEADGVRDGLEIRADMDQWLRQRLATVGFEYAVLKGDASSRLDEATKLVKALI